MIWFTSDPHFGHRNIIEYSKRPFVDLEAHDEGLIANWNAAVRPSDLIYCLGDFTFLRKREEIERLLRRLHGTKFLITGNHDQEVVRKAAGWAKVTPYHEIVLDLGAARAQTICLFHYRMVVWNKSHHGSWALHGHSHGSLPKNYQARTIDVGVDCYHYAPVSVFQLAEDMKAYSFTPVDGHREGCE
jgi:calcineurin-like phosphoesterase family protein